MVKQYIGARYVPIFAGEYNSEMVYEPLSIVTYLNSSYTSKKEVPAGTLPTNTEYWALTGNYNGQVEEYRQEVEGYRQEVRTYHRDVEIYHDTTVQICDNVAALISGNYEAGTMVQTKGYYTVNDKGSALYSIISSRVSGLDLELDNGLFAHIDEVCFNALHYGLSVDNSDNTSIMSNIIANIPKGSILFIPSGTYNFSGSILCNKQIHIVGESSHRANPDLETTNGTILKCNNIRLDYFIRICSDGSSIKYLNIEGPGISSSINNIGLLIQGNLTEVIWEIEITKVSVYNFQFGFGIHNLLTSIFKMCHADHCQNGFRNVGTISTSLSFINCWARNCRGSGFDLNHIYYSTFLNCASDANEIGYYFNDCTSVSFISCGAEHCNTAGFHSGVDLSLIKMDSCLTDTCGVGIQGQNNEVLTIINCKVLNTVNTYSIAIFSNTVVLNTSVDKQITYNGTPGTLRDSVETRSPIS